MSAARVARRAQAFRRVALSLLLGLVAGPCVAAVAGIPPAARSVYALAYANRTQSDLRGLFGASGKADAGAGLVHDIDTRLEGELEQVAVSLDGKRQLVWRLQDLRAQLRINGIDAPEHAVAIAGRLQAGAVLARLDAQGLVEGLHVPADMDAPTRAYARALFSALQFAAPRRRGAPWETREDDQSGRYLARYVRKDDATVRTRLSYLPEQPVLAGEARVVQVIEPGGATRAHFGPDGALAWLEGDETQRVRVGATEIATGATTVRLRRLSLPVPLGSQQRLALATVLADLRARPAERLSASAASASGELGVHRRELGEDTLESLLARLRAFRPASPGSQEATSLFLKFKALVMLQPGTSAALATELASAPPDSETMLLLSQALASGGHAPAQAALASVIRQRDDDWPALAALVPVLGSIAEPEEDSIALLQALASASPHPMIASTATLALGTAAKRLLASSPERGVRVVDWLLARLDGTASPAVRRETLLALGNSADAGALAAARSHADDGDPGVRAAALSALRWIDAPAARELLRARLGSDPVPEVRLAAAQSLRAQRMDAAGFSAQRRAFERETEDGIRVVLLETLWAAVAEHPQARSVLDAARRDASESVREAAARLSARSRSRARPRARRAFRGCGATRPAVPARATTSPHGPG